MPKSVTKKTELKTRASATPQTLDLTPNTPLVDDRNPYWPKSQNAFNEFPVVFQSNRSDNLGTAVGSPATTYHIFRMDGDGGNITALTGPLSSGQVGGSASQTEPATNGTATSVVYVETDSGGSQDLVELNLSSGQSHSLLKGNPAFSFTSVSHPEYGIVPGGNVGVIFSGKATGVTGGNHLFAVDAASGAIVQMTQGACDDRNPTLGPDSSKPVIAFDSNRGDPTGNSIAGNRDIWVIDGNHPLANAVRVTNFSAGGQASENIEPAWSSNKIDQPTGSQHIVKGQQLIGFASTRYDTANDGNANGINPNGTHDIYWLKVNIALDPNNPSNYTVVNPVNSANPPEAPSNVAVKLTTSDTAHVYDDRHPTWPQFITSYRVAYHSDRTFYNPGSGQSGPAKQPNDIFSSTLIDLNSPTLVRFNDATGEVVDIVPRIATPGGTVKISVKLQDLETGIRDVWAQIKNPNSRFQSSDGLEHKVFLLDGLSPDGANVALNTPVEYDSEPIFIGPLDSSGNPTDPRFNTYPRQVVNRSRSPIYTASIDDFFAFSGSTHDPLSASPPGPNHDATKDTGWLQLQFESRDPNTGISTFSANYQTDVHPADYYIDVIAYDNALNPFSTSAADAAVNWTIYDNVWGFTTQTFNPANNVLFVSDYAPGQKFFNSRFGINTLVNVFNTFWGTESWMLEIDPSLFPTSYLPKTGGTTPGTIIDVRNTLGVDSYIDALNNDGTRVGGFPLGATQHYDLWRVLCRGPVPDNILSQYVPRIVNQPPDKINGETNPRPVVVATRCVIWHAPFTGDVFVGPGTLTDLAVQIQLHNFLQAGGRLMVNGQDIGWALTLDGGGSNSFFTNDLKAVYVSDAEPNTLFRIDTFPFIFPTWLPSLDTSYQLAGKPAYDPITHDPWLILNAYLGLAGHVYFGPPFPPGTIDWIDRDANFVSGGTIPGAPGTIRQASPAVAYPDNIQPGPGAISDMTYGNGNSAIIRSQDNGTNSRVVYISMGMEGLADDAYAPPGSSNLIAYKNRRMELMHNIICWMRTGSIVGKVVDTDGGVGLGNVLVRLSNKLDANGKKIVAYTGLTDGTGAFEIDGVEPTTYEITAVLPGFTIQKATFVTTHGGFRDDISFKMSKASAATISGKVTRPDGTTPVVGATVVATDNLNNANKFQATTQADGTYSIKQVPSQTTYTLTVSATGFGASIPVSYQVPNPNDPIAGQRDTLVQSAKAYVGFDFKLKPLPGTLTGQVVDSSNNVGIQGAVVTATQGSTSLTATTDANGNYTFNNNLDPGSWSLVATAPGYAPSVAITVVVISEQSVTAPIIKLDRVAPGSISGLITRTSDNSPLEGVAVELKDATGAIFGNTTTGPVQTGTGGYKFNYKFDTVPAGVTYTVTPTKSGYTAIPTSKQAAVTAATETQNINFQMDALHTFPRQLTMVSAPYDYPSADVGDLLSVPTADRDGRTFIFATWQFGNYVFYPADPANTFHLGRGYFMGYKSNLPLTTLGTAADPTHIYSLNLNPGWNMIGDPFLFNMSWTNVKVVYNGTVYDHDQAVANALIGPALYSYVAGGYVLDYTLVPWKGYWVRAFNNVTLQFDPNTRSVPIAGGNSRAVLNGGQGWSVNLRLNVGELKDEDNYLGVSSRAVDGYDGFKAQKPPLFSGRFASLAFQHENWGDKSGAYGLDIKSNSANVKTWEFTAQTSDANATAVLSWPNASTISRKTTLVLTDLATGASRDMRTTGSYSWSTGESAATRKFRIEAVPATKSGSLVISGVAAQQPSRAVGAGSTVNISYNLSAAADVEVRILGSSGAVVRKLSGRATRASGINQAVWDQRNDQGAMMPAGVYIVEIKAQSGTSGQSAKASTPVLLTR